MLVPQVTELSKSRSKVYIDQEFAFVLYKGELRLYHIKEGQQLSEEDYRTIMQEVLPKRAKLRAMNLLQGREYTTAQLRTKLQQGFYPAEIIEQAIAYVAGFHYIDDLRGQPQQAADRTGSAGQGNPCSYHGRGLAGLAGEGRRAGRTEYDP